jgi:mRNA-degrading endonuclease toxin of MazEF toxin-antitoxin module
MIKKAHKIEKGEIYIIAHIEAFGHEQRGIGPHVVVTQVTLGTVTVAPCRTSTKIKQYTVEIQPDAKNKLDRKSFVLIAQAFATDTSLLSKKIGNLDATDMLRIQLEYVKYVTD